MSSEPCNPLSSLSSTDSTESTECTVVPPKTPSKEQDETVAALQAKILTKSTGEKAGFALTKIQKHKKRLIDAAKATLNTSRYVVVGSKREQRSGVVELEEAYEKLAEEYEKLHIQYLATYDAYDDLFEAASRAIPVYHDRQALAARKFELIEQIVKAQCTDDLPAYPSKKNLAQEFDDSTSK
jgi:hypothetical protein